MAICEDIRIKILLTGNHNRNKRLNARPNKKSMDLSTKVAATMAHVKGLKGAKNRSRALEDACQLAAADDFCTRHLVCAG